MLTFEEYFNNLIEYNLFGEKNSNTIKKEYIDYATDL